MQLRQRPRKTRDECLTEARAEIAWGRSPDLVTDRLIMQGVTPAQARMVIDEAMAERHRSFRGKGVRDLVLGTSLLAALVVLGQMPVSHRLVGGALLLFGLVFLWRGFRRLLFGGREEGADSNVGVPWYRWVANALQMRWARKY